MQIDLFLGGVCFYTNQLKRYIAMGVYLSFKPIKNDCL